MATAVTTKHRGQLVLPALRVSVISDNAAIVRALTGYPLIDAHFTPVQSTRASRWLDRADPDVLLVDLGRSPAAALDLIARSTAIRFRLPIVALSSTDARVNTSAIDSGVTAVLDHRVPPARLARALVHAPSAVKPGQPPEALTPAEVEVLRLTALDLDAKAIGEKLGIARATVYQHRKEIYWKTGAHRTADAAVYAVDWGLLDAATVLARFGVAPFMSPLRRAPVGLAWPWSVRYEPNIERSWTALTKRLDLPRASDAHSYRYPTDVKLRRAAHRHLR